MAWSRAVQLCKDAADFERESIVTFLRDLAGDGAGIIATTVRLWATRIEDGDHHG